VSKCVYCTGEELVIRMVEVPDEGAFPEYSIFG